MVLALVYNCLHCLRTWHVDGEAYDNRAKWTWVFWDEVEGSEA